MKRAREGLKTLRTCVFSGLCRSPSVARAVKRKRLGLAGNVAGVRRHRMQNIEILVRHFLESRYLENRRRWKYNINKDQNEVGCENGRWVEINL